MISNTDNLQYIFACLLTHSKWVEKAKSDLSVVHDNFNITHLDLDVLKEFLEISGEKLLTSALLAEEKRWRELLAVIKYVDKVIPLDQLKYLWDKYLGSFLIHEAIPVTPLHESIRFLEFVLKNDLGLMLGNIINYELVRNKLILYEFSEKENLNSEINVIDLSDNLINFSVRANPSLILKWFEIDIIQVLRQIDTEEAIKHTLGKHKACIGFYKHPVNKIVKTIQFNQKIIPLLLGIKKEKNLRMWIDETLFAHNASIQSIHNFIKKLHDLGVVQIRSINLCS